MSTKRSLAPGAATLAAAVEAVAAVVHDGRSADVALESAEERVDRAAVRAIALGTLRWYWRLAPAMVRLVERPASELDPLIRTLLVTAAHQIEYSRGAPEVSVHLAVDAARALGLARASGYVNALLRRFVSERASLFAADDERLAVRTAHPEWFVSALQKHWPQHVESILEANNLHPPMTLRVSGASGSRETYIDKLAQIGRSATPVDWTPDALVLDRSVPVATLPGFREGAVSVQDAGAQLAAHLLDVSAGQRVLDACAAPGGKAAHLLQLVPQIELLAVDVERERLELLRGTLLRIGAEARVLVGDLADPLTLAAEAPFDRILLDAPCSSTGVIRRHPDIKLLRRAEDIEALPASQLRILQNCFAKLAVGGRLVYATCSVMPEENEQVVRKFLAAEPAAEIVDWPSGVAMPPGALRLDIGVQLLPGSAAGSDGFYYAVLSRRQQ